MENEAEVGNLVVLLHLSPWLTFSFPSGPLSFSDIIAIFLVVCLLQLSSPSFCLPLSLSHLHTHKPNDITGLQRPITCVPGLFSWLGLKKCSFIALPDKLCYALFIGSLSGFLPARFSPKCIECCDIDALRLDK